MPIVVMAKTLLVPKTRQQTNLVVVWVVETGDWRLETGDLETYGLETGDWIMGHWRWWMAIREESAGVHSNDFLQNTTLICLLI